MPRLILLCLLSWLFFQHAQAQGVLISPSSGGQADNSAILELEDSTRGFLLPRLSTIQRNGIQNPAVGLQVYNRPTELGACAKGTFQVIGVTALRNSMGQQTGNGGRYSGGAGGDQMSGWIEYGGGGGGSYNSGTNTTMQSGVRSGHGQVLIAW